jgi:hypothetical protein
MRARALVRTVLAVAVVAGGGSMLLPDWAAASTPSALTVNNAVGSHCSDKGSGTDAVPFCTIGAAAAIVVPGQSIAVLPGTYPENVVINRSGTAAAPIQIEDGNGGAAVNSITVTGAQYVTVGQFSVNTITVANSSHITLYGTNGYGPGSGPMVSFTASHDSAYERGTLSPVNRIGVLVDAASNAISISDVQNSAGDSATGTSIGFAIAGSNTTLTNDTTLSHLVGIDISGADDTVIGGTQEDNLPTGIGVEATASHTTITRAYLVSNRGDGIDVVGAADTTMSDDVSMDNGGAGFDVADATNTALSNDESESDCVGVQVGGASVATSVQNNIVADNRNFCPTGDTAAAIAVTGAAISGTTVDYNTVYDTYAMWSPPYIWDGVPLASVAAFQQASGQGTHDMPGDQCRCDNAYVDSANSAAPGYPASDIGGRTREDDPAIADTGAGPVTDADRGPTETVQGPTAAFAVTASAGGKTITVDASATVPGWAPLGSYDFVFGDGTDVTQAGPVMTHTYAAPGTYQIVVNVLDTNEGVGGTGQPYTWSVPTSFAATLSASTVAAGHTVTATATLTRTDTHQPIGSAQTVSLQWQAAGSSSWTTVASRTTGSTGKATATVTPTGNGSYRWTYAGIPGYLAATGPTEHVSVTTAVTLKATATSIRSGTASHLTAVATPHETGTTVSLQRNETGKGWVTIATGHESATGTVTWAITLPRGTQQLRVVKAATTRYAASTSATITIRVS